uniref:Uncharacterized protein n=1 Tax=viral metagenome TaxID=1070528 RepID=A0A6C0HZH2_9ZZZZ
MDKDSKKIQNFIKKITKKQKDKKRTSQKFSRESRLFIEKIFNQINQAGSLFNNSNISKTKLNEMPTGEYYYLLEDPVKLAIENQLKIFQKTTFSIENRNFEIFMSFSSKLNDAIMDKWIKYIYIWLNIACKYAMPSCSNNLAVYFYFTDMKKLMPDDGDKIMEADNVNTAFTFACNAPNKTRKNEIYVYRLEEWFKVFLHESIHSFGLDFAAMDQTDIQSRICTTDIYKVPCQDLRFYESYTETWAELIYCMFAIFFENKTNMQENKNVSKFEEHIYGCEAPFSAFQCAKVLDHFGLAYSDLFDGAASQYRESTPVFAYYVIKSVFMNNADEFIRWTMENNRGSLQFKKTQTNINLLADLLKSLCKTEDYLKLMDDMDEVLDGPMDYMLAETMRMSCISFD